MTAAEQISPEVGATCVSDGVRFCVWAPQRRRVDVVIEAGAGLGTHPLRADGEGFFAGVVAAASAGDRYRYRLDGAHAFPDPASRFQPDGVHGASEVIDPSRYAWSDGSWTGIGREQVVLYELHLGTFTPTGTFLGVIDKLAYLRDLGVTAIELMPVSDFPGERNWGYDVAALFAPARCYGRPDELRRLVDAAHEHGLAVILDVVYNHLGPDGAYWGAFTPSYFSTKHRTPWGPGINLDGPHSRPVRDFLIQNAMYWLREFHFDGLRLDATHALVDDGPVHFLAELSSRVHAAMGARSVLLFAEDMRNDAVLVRDREDGGYGLDAVWADDFHHHIRRRVAGDCESYYADFSGTLPDLAATIRQGWFYQGQRQGRTGEPRGTDPNGLGPRRFVFCLQNHDQVGNRAFGERLHQQIDPAVFRALTVLLLCAPETPLLFMGQEWAARTPFLFFTDHRPELGRRVTDGRRREFADFAAFRDVKRRREIPDPQDGETFRRSHLNWAEIESGEHAAVLELHRTILRLRSRLALMRADDWLGFFAVPAGDNGLVLLRAASRSQALLVVVQLEGEGVIDVARIAAGTHPPVEEARREGCYPLAPGLRWQVLLATEATRFADQARPISVNASDEYPLVAFARPGAVILMAGDQETTTAVHG